MTNYTSAGKVIPQLPTVVRENHSKATILSWIYQAYQELKLPQSKQIRCCMYNIVNHKAQLCSDVKGIVGVTLYDNTQDPFSFEPYLDISEDGEVQRDCVGNYSINAKLFLNSEDYIHSFLPLKFVGTSEYVDASCCNIFNQHCNNTYSVTPQRMINTNFKEGQICVTYYSHVRDKDGNLMILDNPVLITYLKEYVNYRHLEERIMRGENIAGIYDRKAREMNNHYRKARGEAIKNSLNYKLIEEITTGSFNAIMLKNPKLTRGNERPK